jgi:hypothetical protein
LHVFLYFRTGFVTVRPGYATLPAPGLAHVGFLTSRTIVVNGYYCCDI